MMACRLTPTVGVSKTFDELFDILLVKLASEEYSSASIFVVAFINSFVMPPNIYARIGHPTPWTMANIVPVTIRK